MATEKQTNKKTSWQRYADLQAALPTVELDSTNPHFKSKYASLSAVLHESLAIVRDHGFCLSHTLDMGLWHTYLMDAETGEEQQRFVIQFPAELTCQGLGSWITYARRYATMAILNLRVGDDDDGNAASKTMPAPIELITQEQLFALRSVVGSVGFDEDEFCKKYRIKSLEHFNRTWFGKAMDRLLEIRKQQLSEVEE